MGIKSLGLIETIGLAAGIEAADAAVKSANVKLVGYELAKGSGMTTIKVEGDVGAVKAAVDAAKTAALKVGQVAGAHVIPRPAEGLEKLIRNGDTVGYEPPKPEKKETKPESKPSPKTAPAKRAEPAEKAAPAKKAEPVEKEEAPKKPENKKEDAKK